MPSGGSFDAIHAPEDGCGQQTDQRIPTEFIGAMSAASEPNAPANRWIEHDPVTGSRHLKMPLPPPETARQIADALSALADKLWGRSA